MDGAAYVGLTEKYYKIYEKSGITYIDGIMIANKTYSLPANIYNSYVSNYGFAYAEAYAVRPGHSEHQTGLAIDVTNSSGIFTESTQAKWLAENCVDYGFILRCPEGKSDKTGYNAEAWHIRYVGTRIAEKIDNSGLCLEEYYGITSVYQ